MSDDVLLRFLGKGLINVGGDDAKLEKLQAAAAELATRLQKNPAKTLNFALVAFDPGVPANDPVVAEAQSVLGQQWPTYVNTFSGTPVGPIRAMLLGAMVAAAKEDERVAVAFAASARNALPFVEVGNEKEIWADVVSHVERSVDDRAEAEWTVPSEISVPDLKVTSQAPKIALKSAKVDREALMDTMAAAGGPQGPKGATSGNPHWPNQNVHAWNNEFSKRAAAAIADAIEATTSKMSFGPVDLDTPFQAVTEAVGKHLSTALSAVAGATAGLQRRTHLLWWKEALYSPSARCSYRQLSRVGAVGLMALDLHQQVPSFSPASVSAFLREAVRDLVLGTGGSLDAIAIFDLAHQLANSEELVALRAAWPVPAPDKPGRGPLLSLLKTVSVTDFPSQQRFKELVGIPADSPLALPDFAVWIFRELQAARATTEATRKRAAKKTTA